MTIDTALSGPTMDHTDELLVDVAIRIQLSRTDYDRAVQRYAAINEWIERDGSPLRDLVALFYPQGSMAIGAIITGRRMEGFDIDVVAQLLLAPSIAPREVLDVLYHTIRGTPGSRYYRATKRRTRCVTVEYHDGMHVDVTPAIRRPDTPARESWIFHHRPETPSVPGKKPIANPYGFAEWFKATTPPDHAFANNVDSRAAEYERTLMRAESEPVSRPGATVPKVDYGGLVAAVEALAQCPVPASPGRAAAVAGSRKTPAHTFFGGEGPR